MTVADFSVRSLFEGQGIKRSEVKVFAKLFLEVGFVCDNFLTNENKCYDLLHDKTHHTVNSIK